MLLLGAGEVAYQLRALVPCSSEGPDFHSQNSHSSLQPSIPVQLTLGIHMSIQAKHSYIDKIKYLKEKNQLLILEHSF